MEKRKTPITSVITLGVAAVFSAAPQIAAAQSDTALQFYGHIDVSVDGATKGLKEGGAANNPPPQGRAGWQTDISSNLSYFGFRGDHDIGGGNKMVFQVETQIDVTATPGPSPVNQASQGNVDNKVQGALASRNSFLGFAGSWGAYKVGKTDAPYKLSTARMDPFSATVGDYNSIMGNTGGDNRAEFDTRLSHAMWYESPKWGGASFSALWAPGQNRANDNSNNAAGEPDCTGGGGGQGSGIGQTPPNNIGPCDDGSFGDAYSIAGVYETGGLYGILAYELHRQVNRNSDDPVLVGVGDEAAMKAGVQYMFPTNTIVNAIVEKMTQEPRSGFKRAAAHRLLACGDSEAQRPGRCQPRLGARGKNSGPARRAHRGSHGQRVQHVHARVQALFRQEEQLVRGVCPPAEPCRRALRPGCERPRHYHRLQGCWQREFTDCYTGCLLHRRDIAGGIGGLDVLVLAAQVSSTGFVVGLAGVARRPPFVSGG
jgi:predicted porin